MVFGANTVVIGSKNSESLGTQWLFGKIQWYLGANTAVFGETQWYFWKFSGIQGKYSAMGAYTVKFWENTVDFWANALVFGPNSVEC